MVKYSPNRCDVCECQSQPLIIKWLVLQLFLWGLWVGGKMFNQPFKHIKNLKYLENSQLNHMADTF